MCWSRRFRVTLVVLLILFLPGCLIVPVGMFTENPYNKENLAPLLSGDADRSLVLQKFGSPGFTKENERYWIYTNMRTTLGVIVLLAATDFTDNDWLLVEFDPNGKVVFAESTDWDKCTSNGICYDHFILYKNQNGGDELPHPLKKDECAVYLYLEKLPRLFPTGSVTYSIDGKKIGIVNADSYLYLTHPYGDIEISAYDLSISAKCNGGERLYVRAIKKIDTSWLTGKDLAPVAASEGEKEIRVRHPALHE